METLEYIIDIPTTGFKIAQPPHKKFNEYNNKPNHDKHQQLLKITT
jgi:hypothetical protein